MWLPHVGIEEIAAILPDYYFSLKLLLA